jgi:hypothetical protein
VFASGSDKNNFDWQGAMMEDGTGAIFYAGIAATVLGSLLFICNLKQERDFRKIAGTSGNV